MINWFSNVINRKARWSFFSLQRELSEDYFRDLNADTQVLGKADLDTLLLNASSTFKNDKTTTVAQVIDTPSAVILKRYNARNTRHKFSRALRRSRARRCWDMSYYFAESGLNVAAPILMHEQRFGPIRLDAYFMSERLNGDELLAALPTMPKATQRLVLAAVKDAFTKMKTAKITHGDMKASNLMWVDNALYFIDLDASCKHRFDFMWQRSHAKDKKRFLKNWLNNAELMQLFKEL